MTLGGANNVYGLLSLRYVDDSEIARLGHRGLQFRDISSAYRYMTRLSSNGLTLHYDDDPDFDKNYGVSNRAVTIGTSSGTGVRQGIVSLYSNGALRYDMSYANDAPWFSMRNGSGTKVFDFYADHSSEIGEVLILGEHTSFVAGYVLDAYGSVRISEKLNVRGSFTVAGTKSRVVDTDSHGTIEQYCYEMASPFFGDIGEGRTGEDGTCYVSLDDIFGETVNTDTQYYVFLQKEGPGDIWVEEKTYSYFVVRGTADLSFSWELKARQGGYEAERLEDFDETAEIYKEPGYDIAAAAEVEEYDTVAEEMYVDMAIKEMEDYVEELTGIYEEDVR